LLPVVEDYEEALTRAEATLDAVDAALGRLADGSYGTCATCGAPIAEDRLEAEPATASCGTHPG